MNWGEKKNMGEKGTFRYDRVTYEKIMFELSKKNAMVNSEFFIKLFLGALGKILKRYRLKQLQYISKF